MRTVLVTLRNSFHFNTLSWIPQSTQLTCSVARMSTTVQCIADPISWFLNSSSCLEKDVVGKGDDDALDILTRQNSWELLEQEELLIGGVDGWQLLPLVEEDLTEPWLIGQEYNPSMQSFASTGSSGVPPLVSGPFEADPSVHQELNRGQTTEENLLSSLDSQYMSDSWLDKAMLLEDLTTLTNTTTNLSSHDTQLFMKEEDQQYVVHAESEVSSLFASDRPCVAVPSTVELEDIIDMMDPTPAAEYQMYTQELSCNSELPCSLQDWADAPWSNEVSVLQEEEILSTSCENSEDSFDEDDSLDDEDFIPSVSASRRHSYKKPVKRCGVPRDEYARLTLAQRMERKKEQNKNAATKYREKKRYEEIDKETQCEKLEKRNVELKKEVAEKEREVKLLRKLVINIFRPAEAKKSKATKK